MQWFTGINVFGDRKAASKSSLERYEKIFDEKLVAHEIHKWLADLEDNNKAIAAGLYEAINYKSVFLDTTCVKAHIHFPVDWVLLRDGVRSLLSKRVAMLAIDFRPSWPLKSARMAATHFCAAHAADALVTGARVLRTLAAVSQMA